MNEDHEERTGNDGMPDETGYLIQVSPRLLVTPVLVAANVILFVAMVVAGVSFMSPSGEALIRWGANFGPYTAGGGWWRLFTSMFLHVGILHLLFNMWCLVRLGSLAERLFGNRTFLMLYVLSGLAGSVASLVSSSFIVSAGASGAIFGVAGGLIVFWAMRKVRLPRDVINKNLRSLLFFVIFNLAYGFRSSGIDNAAHLGGLIGGLLIGAIVQAPQPAPRTRSASRYAIVIALVGCLLYLGGKSAAGRITVPFEIAEQAQEYLQQGQLDEAITKAREAIEIQPDLMVAHVILGAGHFEKGDYAEAETIFSEAAASWPGQPFVHRLLAATHFAQGHLDQSLTACRNAVDLDPGNPEFRECLGSALLWSGRYDEALTELGMAVELGADSLAVLNDIAFIRFFQNDFEPAAVDFRAICERSDSISASYIVWWNICLRHLGSRSEAETILGTYASEHGFVGWPLYILQYWQGEMSESVLMVMAGDEDQKCQAHFNVGYRYLLDGDSTAAIEHFQEALHTEAFTNYEYLAARRKIVQMMGD